MSSACLRGCGIPSIVRSLCFVFVPAFATVPVSAQVVISQIFGGGNQAGSLYQEDFVELYNTSASAVNLSTWSIHFQTATGTSWTKINLSGSIPGKAYFLLKCTSTPGTANYGLLSIGTVGGFGDQASSSPNLDPVAGKVVLLNSTGTLSGGACPPTPSAGTIQDYVGYGATANCSEPTGTSGQFANNAPVPDNRNALYRRLCGEGDGNNNSTDFFTGVPSPRNSNVAPNNGISAWASGSPAIVRAGDPVLLMVVPRMCGGGAVFGATVSANLSPLGGSNPQSLYDDGTNGDEVAGDGIYSYLHTVSGGTTAGTKAMLVTVSSGPSSGGCLLVQAVSSGSGPVNDNCRSAAAIAPTGTPGTAGSYGVSGVSVAGNLTGALGEYNASMSNFLSSGGNVSMNGGAMRRGLWYTCIGTGTTMTAELCASAPAFDNVLQVLCGTCDGLSVISAGDDQCGASQARATWCSAPGQVYYVWCASWSTGPTTNAFNVTITDDGAACGVAKPCTVCYPVCPGGAISEGETAPGHSMNDGCDASTVNPSGSQIFSDVTVNAAPLSVCGTLRALGANSGVTGTVDSDWYRFQAGATDTFQATCSAQLPITIQLRQLSASGTCTTNSLLASSSVDRCETANISAPVTAGNWYALKVAPNLPGTVGVATGNNSGFMISATSNTYVATMQNGASPLNDNCGENVASFTILGTGGTASGNSNNASEDAGLPGSSCPAGTRDVWHYFTPASSGNWLIGTCGSSYDSIVNVYTGACGSLTHIGCNDDTPQCGGGTSEVRVNLTSGTLYRIRVASKTGSTGSYNLSVSPSPANDDCGSAQSLNGTCPTVTIGWGGTFQQSNAAATTDGAASCIASSRDMWYSFIPGIDGVWSIETCGSPAGLDTVISMYSSCGGAEMACNDDAAISCPGSLLHSRVTPNLTASTNYLIRVAVKGTISTGGNILMTLIPPSPATNDVCQTSPDPSFVIPGGGGTVSGNLRTASSEGNAASSCQNGEGQKDLHYYFTPNSSCPWTFRTCGCPEVDTTISIHTACPQAANNHQLAANCADAGCVTGTLSSLNDVALSAGTPYVVRVSLWNALSTPGPFTLSVTSGGQIQSTCATATPLTLGASAISDDTTCANNDGSSATCDPGGALSRVLWYSVNLPSALQPNQRMIIDTCGSMIDTALAVYSGNCAAPVQIACSDDCAGSPCGGTSSCLTFLGISAGTYYVRVSDKGTGGVFSIRAAVITTNDTCDTAIAITCGSNTNGSTAGATYESPEPAPCNGPTGSGAQSLSYTEGVWYKITLPGTPGVDDKTITADTFLTSYNTKLWVFSGSCNALTCVTMNDDVQGSPFTSRVAWRAVAGTEYRILVGPYDIVPGSFILRTACDPTPVNDLCTSPTILSGATGSAAFTTIGATGANNTDATAMPGCNRPYSFFDVWYELTACSTGNLTVETCGGYDTILSMHTACPDDTLSNQLEPIGSTCNDDGDVGCAPGSSLITVPVTQGTAYRLRVVGAVGTAAGGTGMLSWSLPDVTLPVISNCPANIVSNTNAANCAATVSWTAPTASDNCPGLSLVRTQGPPPGSSFANGTQTTIEYTATDGSNNTAVCSFTVSVAATPDIDNDGDVDLADMPLFVQVVLGTDMDPLRRYRADTNCDGTVDGRDVRGFVDALLP